MKVYLYFFCNNYIVLRLYPLIPFNGRTAQKDTTLPRGGGPDGLSVRLKSLFS